MGHLMISPPQKKARGKSNPPGGRHLNFASQRRSVAFNAGKTFRPSACATARQPLLLSKLKNQRQPNLFAAATWSKSSGPTLQRGAYLRNISSASAVICANV